MKVLAVNCGSSTLKFDLLATGEDGEAGAGERLARGLADKIGGEATLDFEAAGYPSYRNTRALADHGAAARALLEWLRSSGFLGSGGIEAVGHRVVHGGSRFMEPILIDEDVIAAIEELTPLAPLHNRPALSAIAAARLVLGSDVPMVATFDTAFHRTMPEQASRYAIPLDLADRHHIRRYGFHGLAHRFMAEGYAAISGRRLEESKLITIQLGNGCSAAAIDCGRSVDTSMGFTPLEGLVMGTRSGDVDPSLAGYLAAREGCSIADAEAILNTQSGLLGLSGRSRDMRELLAAEADGDARAGLAVEIFCYRVRKYLGAYLAVLGGANAVIFGGGIGENAPTVRARICHAMGWCGIVLDESQNRGVRGVRARISSDDSAVSVFVVPVDEAQVIAADTERCLVGQHGGPVRQSQV